MIGHVIEGYTIERSLGRGGMGEVYLARAANGAQRAYKIVRGDRLTGPQAMARFRREVTLLDRLKHPGIVQIVSTGQMAGGGLFLAMEYVDGPDLQSAIDRHGPATVADGLRILIQLAEALAFAHHQKIVHRDLKPANVLLAGGDPAKAKIIDFGLAKLAADEGLTRLTDDEQVLGSPLYLAPEQSSSSSVGPEADIYALGGLAYFVMTGAPLFTARTAVAMVYAHVHEMPESLAMRAPDLALPDGFEALITACVAKRPEERPSAEQLVAEFGPMLARAPVSRASRPKFAATELDEAVSAQIRQIVLELAASLEISTEVADHIQNEQSELEIELAMVEPGDERYARLAAHVGELRRGYEEALQALTDEVLSRRGGANEEALYGELDALFARYRR
ncbi:MAG: serine/threonine-protein kinase [Kofleriaceae bacterium]